MELAIDAIWIIKIVVSFLTPFEVDINYNDKCMDIAWHYLFPHFIIDVLSTVYLFVDYSIEYQWMYYLKFLRFAYFFKATSILHAAIEPIVIKCNISKQARSNIMNITSLLIGMSTIMHTIACGWIYVGEKEVWGTWIDEYAAGKEHDATTVYIKSLYWVVTTLTTVGYGDIYGSTEEEFIYTMFVEFIGILVFSIIMSTVNSFLSAQGDVDIVETKSDQVDVWLVKLDNSRMSKSLPKILYDKIKIYITQSLLHDHKKLIDGYDFLMQLKPRLRYELIKELFAPMIRDFDHIFCYVDEKE